MRAAPRSPAGYVLIAVILALALVATVALLLNRVTAMDLRLGLSSASRLEARYLAEAAVEHALWLANRAGCSGYADLRATRFGDHTYAARILPASGPWVGVTGLARLADGTTQSYSRVGVPVYRMRTATFQPGVETDDATIDASEPNSNYGDQPRLVASSFGPETSRGLLRFDLSSVPAGARVSAAELSLYLDGVSQAPAGAEIALHRVARDWVEGTMQGAEPPDGATWLAHDGAAPWASPGGDADPEPTAVLALQSVGRRYALDVTSLATDWVEGAAPNHGVLLQASAGVRAAELVSGDDPDVTKQPRLTIAYRELCPLISTGTTEFLRPIADTYITETGPSSTHGNQNYARIGVRNGGRQYALLRFDVLATIPASATVLSAHLRVYEYDQRGSESFEVSAHAIGDAWTERYASWNDADSGTPWSGGAGGTWDPIALDATIVNTGVPDTREWDVTALVQEWVDGVRPERGVQLVSAPVGNGNHVRFYTRDSPDPRAAHLEVRYAP